MAKKAPKDVTAGASVILGYGKRVMEKQEKIERLR
jgi:hypothetical protein